MQLQVHEGGLFVKEVPALLYHQDMRERLFTLLCYRSPPALYLNTNIAERSVK